MRVIIYDASEKSYLGRSWKIGAALFKARGVVDLIIPAHSWDEAFKALGDLPPRSVKRIQVWGHGSPGRPLIAGERAPTQALIGVLRSVMFGAFSSIWFRACSVAQGDDGKRWVGHVAQAAGCRVAAHTFIVGPWQSGLRVALPDDPPSWSSREGNDPATGEHLWSRPGAVRTVSMMAADIPDGWTQ